MPMTACWILFCRCSEIACVGEFDPVAELAGEVPAVSGDHVRRGDGGEFDEQVGVEAAGLFPELMTDTADQFAVRGASDAGQVEREGRVAGGG